MLTIIFTFSGCRETTEETTILSFVEEGKVSVSEVENSSTNNIGTNNSSSNNSSSNNSDTVSSNPNSVDDDITDTVILTEEELRYKPTSLTLTLYDSQNLVYGFTYNTLEKPIKPVIQIKKSDAKKWNEYALSSEKTLTFDGDWAQLYYYVSKATIKLDVNSTYIYRICDTGAEKKYGKYIGTDDITFKTKNPKTNSFTFIHVSDTQRGSLQFGRILSAVKSEADFLLHTGDFVQNPHEDDWIDMLDTNFKYLSSVPIMPI